MSAVEAARRPTPPVHVLRKLTTVAVLVIVLWALLDIDLKYGRLIELPGRLLDAARLMFVPPDWAYASRAWEGMLESIHIAWIGTIIGAVLSVPLGLFGAENVATRPVAGPIRLVLNAIRAIPELVLALVLFIPIVGLGAFAGTLAIGVHSIGTLGKLTAEVIEGIDEGPVEAARATGAGTLTTFRWGVLPQVLPEIVAFWLYRFEINLRASAILGLVGAGGVGAVLSNTLTFRRWDKAGMTVLVIVAATIAIDALSGALRRKIIRGTTKGAGEAPAPAPDIV
jgi:phosphonate transport system permease protein